jgi:K+-sensing histidine kinase KdpD
MILQFKSLFFSIIDVSNRSRKGQKVIVKGKYNEDEYLLEVHDFGRGFQLESLSDIAPFKQFNRKRFEQQGLGIGLYLVKRIVDFNQGELKISPIEREGTSVYISLPLAQEHELMPRFEQYQNA